MQKCKIYVPKKQKRLRPVYQATNDEKMVDLQWRNMRENLIFSGIPESQLGRGEYEDCESLIKCFIRE